MGLLKKVIDKLYLKQWGIGIFKGDIQEIIRNKITDFPIHWIPIPNRNLSYADPFFLDADASRIRILHEEMTSFKMDGVISLMELDGQFQVIGKKRMLKKQSHLSYPFVFREKGKIFVLPENALGGLLECYEYDEKTNALINPVKVLDFPALDSTIIQRDGKYWLFCTLLGNGSNSDLHIYFSDQLFGPFQPHPQNPVKTALSGSRPAGNFIEVDGELYRPAQNCTHYYGEALTILKLTALTEAKFEEEFYMEIKPKLADEFNYGLHTLNVANNYIVVDGQKSHFQPVQQLMRKIRNLVVKT